MALNGEPSKKKKTSISIDSELWKEWMTYCINELGSTRKASEELESALRNHLDISKQLKQQIAIEKSYNENLKRENTQLRAQIMGLMQQKHFEQEEANRKMLLWGLGGLMIGSWLNDT